MYFIWKKNQTQALSIVQYICFYSKILVNKEKNVIRMGKELS